MPDDGTADISRQCHRADLHAVLAAALMERAPGALHLDHQVVGIEESAHGARAIFANRDKVEADKLVAADGVRSAVRPLLWGEEPPRYTGQIAYRFLLDRASAAPFLGLGRGTVFLGPARTFNRYTLRSGALLYCVGIAATDAWADEGWAIPADRDEMAAAFAGWHPDVLGLIAHAPAPINWGIFDRAP